MIDNTIAEDKLVVALDCILAAEELASKDVFTAERFCHRAYELVDAALHAIRAAEKVAA